MPQQNLLQLAKQGNPDAIAALINRKLQPKGITVNISREGNSLEVVLKAEKIPNQAKLTQFIQGGLKKLGVIGIESVRVTGQEIGDESLAWEEMISLKTTHEIKENSDSNTLSKKAESSKEETNDTTSTKKKTVKSEETGCLSGCLLFVVITLGLIASGAGAVYLAVPYLEQYGRQRCEEKIERYKEAYGDEEERLRLDLQEKCPVQYSQYVREARERYYSQTKASESVFNYNRSRIGEHFNFSRADLAWHAVNTYGWDCQEVLSVERRTEPPFNYEYLNCANGLRLRVYYRVGDNRHPIIKNELGTYGSSN